MISPVNNYLTHESIALPSDTSRVIIEKLKRCYRKALNELDLNLTNKEKSLQDIITLGVKKKIVVLSCGHDFDQEGIKDHLSRHPKKCPLNCPVTGSMRPSIQLNQFYEEAVQNLIVNCEECTIENPARAKAFLLSARTLKEIESDYVGALEAYQSVFKWTKSTVIYKEVVRLYEKMQIPDRAECAKIYLAILQLKEGLLMDALQTLKKCNLSEAKIQTDFLRYHLRAFKCIITWGELQDAQQKFSIEQMTLLCRFLLKHQPQNYPLYFGFADLIEPWEERGKILQEGYEVAKIHDPEMAVFFKTQIELFDQSRISIWPSDWGNTAAIKAKAPWPKDLNDFWSLLSSKEKTQYFIFPMPTTLNIKGEYVPCTCENLEKVAKSANSKFPGTAYLAEKVLEEPLPKGEINWYVMTRNLLKRSCGTDAAEQQSIILEWQEEQKQKYPQCKEFSFFRIPTATEAVCGMFWHWQEDSSLHRLYCHNSTTTSYIDEDGDPMSVGHFRRDGLFTEFCCLPEPDVGVALLRCFKSS